MSGQVKITLRPPAHRSYLNGYPGIPSSLPAANAVPPADPLLVLPTQLRPQAHLSGTVEVRPSLKGTRAKWLRVELEKVENIPAQGGAAQGKGKDVKSVARFVELIGNGPGILWEASRSPQNDKKGKDDDEGWELIPEANYPFKIPLPEGLPPSCEVDSKGCGISYQLVATLCSRGKKGLLKSTAKVAMLDSKAPIELQKLDILPTWPAYAPILPPPLPPQLPWANPHGQTTGETRESKLSVRGEGSGISGEVWMKCTRQTGAFGPGDAVQVRVQLGWGGSQDIKLTRLDFVLRETITFRYPASSSSGTGGVPKSQPRTSSIFTANASVSGDPANPSACAILHENRPASFDLTGIVPSSHSRVTVRTAKHVDVAYHLKVRAMLEGGEEVSVDGWGVFIGGLGSREAKGLMEEIGWVEGLCDRPGVIRDPRAALGPAPVVVATQQAAPVNIIRRPENSLTPAVFGSSTAVAPSAAPVTQRSHPGPADLGATASGAPTSPASQGAKSRPLSTLGIDIISSSEQGRSHSPPPPAPNGSGVLPSAEQEKKRLYDQAAATAQRHQDYRVRNPDSRSPSDLAGQTAEQEKERLFRDAAQTRDQLQGSIGSSERRVRAPLTSEDEKKALHDAATALRDQVQQGLAPASPSLSTPAPVRSATQPLTAPSSQTPPGRSSSVILPAEAEKKRLFEAAKALARQKQEEARIELEKLEAMEREEGNMSLREIEADQTRRAEDEYRRAEAERLRVAEDFRIKEERDREQAERARAAEAQWRHEESERQKAAQALHEEQLRAEELQRQAEQRRQAEQKRQHDARVQSDMLMRRNAASSPQSAARALYEGGSPPAHEYPAFVAPTPQNPLSNHQQLNSRGSFSPSPVSSAHEFAPQSYPRLSPAPDGLPRHFAGPERSPSAGSFAPTTPMDQANQAYYINAIQSSLQRNPTSNSNEKEAYLRSVRERSEANRSQGALGSNPARHHSMSPYAAPVHDPFAAQGYGPPPTAAYQQGPYPPQSPPAQYQGGSYDYSAGPVQPVSPRQYPAQPVPPQQYAWDAMPADPPAHSSPHTQPTPSAPQTFVPSHSRTPSLNLNSSPVSQARIGSPLAPNDVQRPSTTGGPTPATNGGASPPPAPTQQWKSALEEKEEERARRAAQEARAEVREGKQARTDEPDSLPTYETDAAPSNGLKTAAQEKADLTAHYERAKAAVDSYQRGPPPPPPSPRQRSMGPQQYPSPSQQSFPPTAPSHEAAPLQSNDNGGQQFVQQPVYGQPQNTPSSPGNPPPMTPLQTVPETPSAPSQTPPPSTPSARAQSPPSQTYSPSPSDSNRISSEYRRDPEVKSGKQRSTTMDRDSAAAPDLYAHWNAPSAPDRQSAPWMLSSPDFGSFSLADGLGSSFGGSGAAGGSTSS